MDVYTTAGALFHYTIAVILFSSCTLLFIASRADEKALARVPVMTARTLEVSAQVDPANYAQHAALCRREAELTEARERRALLMMIAQAWTQMSEQARRIRWAMALLEIRKQS